MPASLNNPRVEAKDVMMSNIRPLRKWVKRVALALLSLIALAYVGMCIWLKVNGHRLVFTRELPVEPTWESLGLQPHTVQIGNLGPIPLSAWSIPSLPDDSQANQWVLHFHGSGDNVTSGFNQTEFHRLRGMGFSILAPQYPGYAGKPGEPTELTVEQEAQIAYDYLRKTNNVPDRNIVIYGTSIGTGVAVDLASHVRAGALVLLTPYTSVIDVGKIRYPYIPISLLASDRFESVKKIGAVRMPVFIYHTVEDKVIPIEQARQLYELAGTPKHFEEAHGPHGQHTYPFFLALQEFLSGSTALKMHSPRKGIWFMLKDTVEAKGVRAAIAEYQEMRAQHDDEYNFAEYELSNLGYDLLRKGKSADAITILKLNAQEYPNSFNVYDDLGDAYLQAGDKQAAEQNFRRSVQVYPGADNYSRKKLDALVASTKTQ
jgi:fermentation-respiration switch protein FrsA (DUF1100 family)